MYNVEISPAAKDVLNEYVSLCLKDNGEECALRFIDSYEEKISFLEMEPLIGCARLRYIPAKYRVINFGAHLWLVFQVNQDRNCVKIDYVIDDRQNYGPFLR